MSENLQPGLHPDPDALNALIEGVLPEHERLQCLAHLAECPACREVVYLAEEPLAPEPLAVPAVPADGKEKVSFWERWFTPVPALVAATAFATLILSLGLYRHVKSAPNPPEMVADARSAQMSAPAPQEALKPPLQIAPTPRELKQRAIPRPQTRSTSATTTGAPAVSAIGSLTPPPAPIPAAAPTLPVSAEPLASATPPAASPAPRSALLDAAANTTPPVPQTGIAGTITDPAGAGISGATVKLRPLTSPASRSLTSDPKGQFNVAGLEPGRYELQVFAPGFRQLTEQVDIQPNQMARADSILPVGSVSESISVTAEVPQVRFSTSVKTPSAVPPLPAGRRVPPPPAGIMSETTGIILPSKLPAGTTVVNGKITLATDSAGALFLSQNEGKKWKTIKPVWTGKIVNLTALPAPASGSGPSVQLTTDAGATWLSRDGTHWTAAPQPK